jgi:hypothetical protein
MNYIALLQGNSDGLFVNQSLNSPVMRKISYSNNEITPIYSQDGFDGNQVEIKDTFEDAWKHLEDAWQNAVDGVKKMNKKTPPRTSPRRQPVNKQDFNRVVNNTKRSLKTPPRKTTVKVVKVT